MNKNNSKPVLNYCSVVEFDCINTGHLIYNFQFLK